MIKIWNDLFWKAKRFLSRQSKGRIFWMSVMWVAVLGTLDYLTGSEFSFSIFYLAPAFLVAWTSGFGRALLISTLSITAMIVADYFSKIHYPHPFIVFWNELARFGFFVIYSFLIAGLRRSLNNERTLSREDYLTGIPNRRAFYESVFNEILRASRHLNPITVVYIDIDNFKPMNDRFGHFVGDKILVTVAETIKSTLRSTDTVARLGGDEFAILLPETNSKISNIVVQKANDELLRATQKEKWPISFSIGIVTFNRAPKDADEIIQRADALMYDGKKAGGGFIRHEVVDGNLFAPIESMLWHVLHRK